MNGIERRIKELEKRSGTDEPIKIHIHKTIIGHDGEVASESEKVVQLNGRGRPGT